MNEITEGTAADWEPVVFSGVFQDRRPSFIKIEKYSTVYVSDMLGVMLEASYATGSQVEISPEFCFCPVLRDGNGRVLPLYKFVEILDECVDYEDIREEMPTFSYTQINGALSFLRKMAQYNSDGIDIDTEMDQELFQERVFLEKLRDGLADQGSSHVFNLNQYNR